MLFILIIIFTSPFRRASAVETISATGTSATVGAGITGAVVDSAIRRITHETGIADTLRSMSILHADAVRWTGRVFAETPQFAMATHESWEALAMVSAHIVDTFAAVGARFGQTLVQIKLAILTLEARRTVADVGAVIIIAYTVVQAWVRQTFINVYVAVDALIAEENKWKEFVWYI